MTVGNNPEQGRERTVADIAQDFGAVELHGSKLGVVESVDLGVALGEVAEVDETNHRDYHTQ